MPSWGIGLPRLKKESDRPDDRDAQPSATVMNDPGPILAAPIASIGTNMTNDGTTQASVLMRRSIHESNNSQTIRSRPSDQTGIEILQASVIPTMAGASGSTSFPLRSETESSLCKPSDHALPGHSIPPSAATVAGEGYNIGETEAAGGSKMPANIQTRSKLSPLNLLSLGTMSYF